VIAVVPALNPLVAFTTTLASVASPPETGAVPKVVPPIEKTTLPVMDPAVVELTDATSSVAPPSGTQSGAAVSVVVVVASTVSVVLPLEVA
jgi:hypothetical protein